MGAAAVIGMDDLLRDFRRLQETMPRETEEGLRVITEDFAKDVQAFARVEGLLDSGALVANIQPFYKNGLSAGVMSNVERRNYPYGGVYEYGLGRKRAYLEPTLLRDANKILERFDDMVGRLLTKSNLI
jgi:hypothetical protein